MQNFGENKVLVRLVEERPSLTGSTGLALGSLLSQPQAEKRPQLLVVALYHREIDPMADSLYCSRAGPVGITSGIVGAHRPGM